MPTTALTASERATLLRYASALPNESETRRAIVAAVGKTAASSIPMTDLPAEQQKVVAFFEQSFHMKPVAAWDGIHGYVVNFKVAGLSPRFDTEDLKKMLSLRAFRWMEQVSDDTLSVGI